ncbi:MAG: SURF1 family protein [Alphaproteobacteria bacterium]|nr:SURF1 family protein [Alphaproteobacteria bacterium]
MTDPQAHRFPLWGTLLMIGAIIVLSTLGYWQMQRLEWKNEIIATLQAAYARNPLTHPLNQEQLDRLSQQQTPLAYASLNGQFLHQYEMKLGPRTHEGTPGYHLITPFHIDADNSYVLVNRGWVPLEQSNTADQTIDRVSTPVLLTGLVRKPDQPNHFTPPNDPAQDTWYSLNTTEILEKTGLAALPAVIFYAESQSPALTAPYPQMAMTRTMPANNHLQYALFWFGMAALFSLLYALVILKALKARQAR